MPDKGWKVITIREIVYEALQKKARKENNAVSRMAEKILAEQLGIEVEEIAAR